MATKSNLFIPLLIIAVGLILIIGAIFSYFYFQKESPESLNAPTFSVKIPFPYVERIALNDAKEAFDTENAIFIDVRGEPWFGKGHSPGAYSITKEEIAIKTVRFNKNDLIITYCT